ncbi:hypothetical protein SADUNF_Sadunf10G0000500 [Salix dunnii]|uniref:Uncharacterized protein n=1 Tax=Salix dunnii TaxID=1413687 RepID=A0A835JUF9_9ROSI|nr:hypothetical protein SADUNF_Sadunf10G0000500 [Salix dunnii]
MASDSWVSRFSASSRRYLTRSDLYEETEAEEDLKAEYLCPFCAEGFDVVGLFCHIDEDHPVEAKNGRFGSDFLYNLDVYVQANMHIYVVQMLMASELVFLYAHSSPLSALTGDYIQRKRRLRKGGANSAFSILRKELREGSLQSLLGGSSCFVSSSNTEPDPLLSPFIFNPPGFDEVLNTKPLSSVEASSVKGSASDEFLERKVQPQLSVKDQEEKSRKSEFVQGLMLSTILDDEL